MGSITRKCFRKENYLSIYSKIARVCTLSLWWIFIKISFELHKFLEVFQEFQNISGQDMVDAINDCYEGYFQELLVAIGKLHFVWWTTDLPCILQSILTDSEYIKCAWVRFNWKFFLNAIIWMIHKLQESPSASGLMQLTGKLETLIKWHNFWRTGSSFIWEKRSLKCPAAGISLAQF